MLAVNVNEERNRAVCKEMNLRGLPLCDLVCTVRQVNLGKEFDTKASLFLES